MGRAFSEGQTSPSGRTEQIGDQGEVGIDWVGEEEGRPLRGNHAAMDLRDFEPRVYRCIDGDQITLATQSLQEGAEIGDSSTGHRRDATG